MNENNAYGLNPAQAEAYAEDRKAHDIAFAEGVAAFYGMATEKATDMLPAFERSKTLDVLNRAYKELTGSVANTVWENTI